MERNIAYDGLRGWLLIIISCNHLYGNFIPQITRSPLGFISAAEGFVFLSGFVAYLVYSRLATDKAQIKRKIWQRSFTIYGFHITALILCFTLIWMFPYYTQQWSSFFNAENWFDAPVQSLIAALLLLEHPGYHDILILYLVPMIFLPFAIIAIKKGKVLLVAAASISVWIVAQFVTAQHIVTPFDKVFPDISLNVSYFDPFAWQIYFYTGVLLSYLKLDKSISFNFPPIIKISLLTCIAFTFIIKHFFPELMQPYLSGNSEASLLFQLNLLLTAYFFMLIMRNFRWFFTLKYPVFLGQHALPVFAFHNIAIYFLQPWSEVYTTEKWYWDLLTCILFVSLLAIPAKLNKAWHTHRDNNWLLSKET